MVARGYDQNMEILWYLYPSTFTFRFKNTSTFNHEVYYIRFTHVVDLIEAINMFLKLLLIGF